jgi:dolichol-phosphate mannosyltransferase
VLAWQPDCGSCGETMRPLVIVPTYIERQNVRRLLPQLLDIADLRILVVDDASPDGTGFAAEVIAEHNPGRVEVMHRVGRPRGLRNAYLDGIRRALETDADVICQMDANLSHQPAHLRDMLAAVAHADLVIGSRYVAGGRIANGTLRRKLLQAGANAYVRAVCSMPVHDCTSGFLVWRRDALASLTLRGIDASGSALLVQLLYEAVAIGCTVSEVPITCVERAQGRSTMRLRDIAKSAVLPWTLAFSRATGQARHAGVAGASRPVTAAASVPAARLLATDSGPR